MDMKRVGFVYGDIFLKHETPNGHPECKERLKAILDALKDSDVWDSLVHIKPRKATFKQIETVHDHSYVEKIKKTKKGYADPDTYISPKSLEAAQNAAGAVLEAIDLCKGGEIERAFCAVRPPGHHAEADRAMGFCLFNNVAIGARYAQQMGYKKVLIIDFDVHHGNGTQHIFEEDDTVFYFSSHQYPHYPGTGEQVERGRGKGEDCTANYPLAAGSGDREYYLIYHDILPHVIRKFSPDIILVSAGYDIHQRDPLAFIRITDEGIRNIVTGILTSAQVPAIFCLEGGYDLKALADSVLHTIRLLINTV
jgi:acetoin utilization deacetylase AcuC-like enzyme